MPFTEDQFNKFMDGILQNQKDRELLIRIHENTNYLREKHLDHEKKDEAKFADHDNKINRAHERIDDFESLKNKIIGGSILAVGVIGFAAWVIENFKR